jgi:RNA polymerase sigma-70 factor (sigma-E family)
MGEPSDRAGFTAWALAARPRLLRTATALTAADHHLAEDLVQTALVRVYAAWPRVDRDDPSGYAHRTLVRAFVDETRRPWWRRERFSRPVDATDADAAAAALIDPDDVRAVRDVLALLTAEQRLVVVLRYWAGHDVAETARLIGCPPATVRSRAARGLAQLRELLHEDGLDGAARSSPPTLGGSR